MVSLINKQLLLTAYAYLYIMGQQKVQQASEALRMNKGMQKQHSGVSHAPEIDDEEDDPPSRNSSSCSNTSNRSARAQSVPVLRKQKAFPKDITKPAEQAAEKAKAHNAAVTIQKFFRGKQLKAKAVRATVEKIFEEHPGLTPAEKKARDTKLLGARTKLGKESQKLFDTLVAAEQAAEQATAEVAEAFKKNKAGEPQLRTALAAIRKKYGKKLADPIIEFEECLSALKSAFQGSPLRKLLDEAQLRKRWTDAEDKPKDSADKKNGNAATRVQIFQDMAQQTAKEKKVNVPRRNAAEQQKLDEQELTELLEDWRKNGGGTCGAGNCGVAPFPEEMTRRQVQIGEVRAVLINALPIGDPFREASEKAEKLRGQLHTARKQPYCDVNQVERMIGLVEKTILRLGFFSFIASDGNRALVRKFAKEKLGVNGETIDAVWYNTKLDQGQQAKVDMFIAQEAVAGAFKLDGVDRDAALNNIRKYGADLAKPIIALRLAFETAVVEGGLAKLKKNASAGDKALLDKWADAKAAGEASIKQQAKFFEMQFLVRKIRT